MSAVAALSRSSPIMNWWPSRRVALLAISPANRIAMSSSAPAIVYAPAAPMIAILFICVGSDLSTLSPDV